MKAGTRDERGVIAPLTALLMVALLGMTAFAVDTAMMYSEHAQLQNGADSSALAIAQACAKDPSSADCASANAAATALAGGNALDGVSHVASVNFGTGTVEVTTQARDTAGNNHFSLVFARALGIDTADIRASAEARIEGYSAADVVPLTFSKCESDPGFTKGLQFFPEHGSAMADQPGWKCTTPSSSGLEVPGGFGWLDQSSPCTSSVTVGSYARTDPGGNFPSECTAMFARWKTALEAGKPVDVLVPIFDNVTGSGSGAKFRIEAFAHISIRGWHFNGGGSTYYRPDASALSSSLGLSNPDTGLFGKFIKKVTLADAAAMGGPTTYGAMGVRLSK
ncbi:pilus assembly protein TadG-related protein [Pseudarthrobacter sp. H2]|uniref:pilus assembly protein TadG-related protein n=1 Tax=Pseudarthrobacter sp. H2 TaxID=3418415 RepID=UPI003CEC2D36